MNHRALCASRYRPITVSLVRIADDLHQMQKQALDLKPSWISAKYLALCVQIERPSLFWRVYRPDNKARPLLMLAYSDKLVVSKRNSNDWMTQIFAYRMRSSSIVAAQRHALAIEHRQ